MRPQPSYRMAPEVADALRAGHPVVALESTLVAHGLPWPVNVETAEAAEAAVRAAAAIPATIAVFGGIIHIGLDREQREHLARRGAFQKASRRDLGAIVAQRRDAATTVSATLWIARGHGITVMATGGLGGVHRGAGTSFDVSNDLDELARADGTLVVCSGAKVILDLPATLEALETRGVAVIGYRAGTLPAFTVASSGLPLEHRVETPAEAAALVHAHRELGLPGAIVLARRVPEAEALDPAVLSEALDSALSAAAGQGIAGKAITPFLLDQLRDATDGRSLRANVALIVANAALAAEIAVVLSEQDRPEAKPPD